MPDRSALSATSPGASFATEPAAGGTMRFDKFTVKAQEAVAGAQELAQRHDNPELLPLHLLAALLAEQAGIVRPLIQKVGARVERIDQIVADELSRLPKATGTQIGMSRAAQDVFADAQKE